MAQQEGRKLVSFALVRDQDGKPKIDDAFTLPLEIEAMMTGPELEDLDRRRINEIRERTADLRSREGVLRAKIKSIAEREVALKHAKARFEHEKTRAIPDPGRNIRP